MKKAKIYKPSKTAMQSGTKKFNKWIIEFITENPGIDLRMVFQDPYKKISKKSKTTYAQWCKRYGIKWCAFHAIPIDWLT